MTAFSTRLSLLFLPVVFVVACGSSDSSSSSSNGSSGSNQGGSGGSGAGASGGSGGSAAGTGGSGTNCASDSYWTEVEDSPDMFPGRACLDCHKNPTGGFDEPGPNFPIAGTVFTDFHIADACQPTSDQGTLLSQATVIVTDATNKEFSMPVRSSGNFYQNFGTITFPIKAKVVLGDKVREMVTEQQSADCNSCHTETGNTGAPGRILLPE